MNVVGSTVLVKKFNAFLKKKKKWMNERQTDKMNQTGIKKNHIATRL